jgi:hypothetical protein
MEMKISVQAGRFAIKLIESTKTGKESTTLPVQTGKSWWFSRTVNISIED